jgi:hypothetical protein
LAVVYRWLRFSKPVIFTILTNISDSGFRELQMNFNAFEMSSA